MDHVGPTNFFFGKGPQIQLNFPAKISIFAMSESISWPAHSFTAVLLKSPAANISHAQNQVMTISFVETILEIDGSWAAKTIAQKKEAGPIGYKQVKASIKRTWPRVDLGDDGTHDLSVQYATLAPRPKARATKGKQPDTDETAFFSETWSSLRVCNNTGHMHQAIASACIEQRKRDPDYVWPCKAEEVFRVILVPRATKAAKKRGRGVSDQVGVSGPSKQARKQSLSFLAEEEEDDDNSASSEEDGPVKQARLRT